MQPWNATPKVDFFAAELEGQRNRVNSCVVGLTSPNACGQHYAKVDLVNQSMEFGLKLKGRDCTLRLPCDLLVYCKGNVVAGGKSALVNALKPWESGQLGVGLVFGDGQ